MLCVKALISGTWNRRGTLLTSLCSISPNDGLGVLWVGYEGVSCHYCARDNAAQEGMEGSLLGQWLEPTAGSALAKV